MATCTSTKGACCSTSERACRRSSSYGEIDEFTGVSAPYEEPLEPELRLDTSGRTPTESAATVLERLEELNLLPARVESTS